MNKNDLIQFSTERQKRTRTVSPKEALKEELVTRWPREPHYGTHFLTFSTSTLAAAVKRVRTVRVTGCREKLETMTILGNQNVSLVS